MLRATLCYLVYCHRSFKFYLYSKNLNLNGVWNFSLLHSRACNNELVNSSLNKSIFRWNFKFNGKCFIARKASNKNYSGYIKFWKVKIGLSFYQIMAVLFRLCIDMNRHWLQPKRMSIFFFLVWQFNSQRIQR